MRKITLTFILFLATVAVTPLHAQVSAFTYQGRLDLNGTPANGSYDFMFRLLNDPTNGVAAPVIPINPAVPVTNGLFTTGMDFGAENFNGANRWLEINVRTNGGGPFTTLAPRQLLTPAPYAVAAQTASNLLGGLPASQISGTIQNASLPASPSFPGTVTANAFSGSGAGLTDVNATMLGGLNSSNFWRTTGNAGTTPGTHFLGTSDNESLEIKVNGLRALRIEPRNQQAPNLIGGYEGNMVAAGIEGAVIAGGGARAFSSSNYIASSFSTVGGGSGNRIDSDAWFTSIPGGFNNIVQAQSEYAFIGGGRENTIRTTASYSVVGGGETNTINSFAYHATIGGGGWNTIHTSAGFATAAGGYNNTIYQSFSTISGGAGNSTHAYGSTIGGGRGHTIAASSDDSFIGGGFKNTIGPNSIYAGISGGYQNQIGYYCPNAVIAGGWNGVIHDGGQAASIGGGYFNEIRENAIAATIAGGNVNRIGANASYATISGGYINTNNGSCATVPGGSENAAMGDYSFAAGRRAKANHSGALVWGDSANADIASTNANSVTMRASGGYRLFTDSTATTGAFLAAGSGSWTSMSDRNAKENFRTADAREVLEKVVALPMQTWNYKSQDASIRHIGPMAQDFKAAFDLGESETGIATVDADGVALAAIQGLNQKLEETRAQNLEFKRRLAELERLVQQLETQATQP